MSTGAPCSIWRCEVPDAPIEVDLYIACFPTVELRDVSEHVLI
jgi:hypothetical protein